MYSFQNETLSFEVDHRVEVKLLLRRATSYTKQNEMKKAKVDLDKCKMYEPRNPEIKVLLDKVDNSLNIEVYAELKETGRELQMQSSFIDALQKYEECLKLTQRKISLNNIGVFVNKVACYLSLFKYQKVVTECNTALVMIGNYRAKKVGDWPEKETEEKTLREYEFRLLRRRAQGLLHLKRDNEAIADLNKALKINPGDESLKRDIANISSSFGTPAPAT